MQFRPAADAAFPAERSLRDAILTGSMTLLVGSGLVSAINLAYNILLARSLGAAGFGHAVSIYTVLMLLSAVTLSFQFVCSKFVAKNTTLRRQGRGLPETSSPLVAGGRVDGRHVWPLAARVSRIT